MGWNLPTDVMKILMASSEMASLVRTGGLGDVLETLPVELQKLGHEVSVVLPLYRSILEKLGDALQKTGVRFGVYVGHKRVDAEILEFRTARGVQVFLVRCDEYFDRGGIYGASQGGAYGDNAERFIFFDRAVVELACRLDPAPEVIHAHDWQGGLIPAMVHQRELPFRTVFTIHNVAYQGSFWGMDFGLTGLPGPYFSPAGVEFFGALNFLKAGVVFADAITTVSERYAHDLRTEESGAGLHQVMREQSARLVGILNGADYETWDPAIDPRLPEKYSADNLAGKDKCRTALLERMGWKKSPRGPVYAMVTRLAEQKGFDILLPLLDRLLSDDVRLVILGEGDPKYARDLLIARKKHRERFAFQREFDDGLAHLIEAGADVTLIPSHFEPGGLSAMYSLKYGAVPIARACGGLHQIVRDYDPATGGGNGLTFYDYSQEALWDAILRARRLFTQPEKWTGLMRRGMSADFSWAKAAEAYAHTYARVMSGSLAARPAVG